LLLRHSILPHLISWREVFWVLVLTFVPVYEEWFERPYGFWRPYLQKILDRYLDCGNPHLVFAGVKCRDYNLLFRVGPS
jgi:hypothetical protein